MTRQAEKRHTQKHTFTHTHTHAHTKQDYRDIMKVHKWVKKDPGSSVASRAWTLTGKIEENNTEREHSYHSKNT